MKAIILAGGRGERLKPLTNKIPKPMIEVDSNPILLHAINLLKKYGIKDFIIALCFLPQVIVDYFGNGKKFGVNIEYTYEDPEKPLGTAGASLLSRELINDTFIVTSGDILRELNINKMVKFHKKNKSFATLNVYKRISKDAKSKVVIDKNHKVIEFIERPSESDLNSKYIWVNGSFYIFEPGIFDFIPDYENSDFGSDVFPKVLKAKKDIYAFSTDSYFVDIGNLEKLEYARKTFSKVL